jgi:polysaccharide pyruvyl transferase WcaK-like protein
VGQKLAERLQAPLWPLGLWLPREVRWLTERAVLVVSSRYHGLVFATAAGVPAVGLYSDRYTRVKAEGALAHAGLEKWTLGLDAVATGGLFRAATQLWERRAEVRRQLHRLQERAVGAERARWEAIRGALEPEAAIPDRRV